MLGIVTTSSPPFSSSLPTSSHPVTSTSNFVFSLPCVLRRSFLLLSSNPLQHRHVSPFTMLAATRRVVLSASRRSAAIADNHFLPSNFVVGCSKDLERDQRTFSTSASAREKPRVKLSKEKLSAKLDKLERKREQRAVKAISAGAAVAEARVAKMERGFELQEKRSTAQVSSNAASGGGES